MQSVVELKSRKNVCFPMRIPGDAGDQPTCYLLPAVASHRVKETQRRRQNWLALMRFFHDYLIIFSLFQPLLSNSPVRSLIRTATPQYNLKPLSLLLTFILRA